MEYGVLLDGRNKTIAATKELAEEDVAVRLTSSDQNFQHLTLLSLRCNTTPKGLNSVSGEWRKGGLAWVTCFFW